MVAREGFIYEQKPLSVTRNVVVWEGWSLVRVVVRQGLYCNSTACTVAWSVCEGLSATTNIMYCCVMFNRILTRGRMSNLRTTPSSLRIVTCSFQTAQFYSESTEPRMRSATRWDSYGSCEAAMGHVTPDHSCCVTNQAKWSFYHYSSTCLGRPPLWAAPAVYGHVINVPTHFNVPIRPSDERPPAMYGYFCLVPMVSVHDRYYCTPNGASTYITCAKSWRLSTPNMRISVSILVQNVAYGWQCICRICSPVIITKPIGFN